MSYSGEAFWFVRGLGEDKGMSIESKARKDSEFIWQNCKWVCEICVQSKERAKVLVFAKVQIVCKK